MIKDKLEFYYDYSDKVCLRIELDASNVHPFCISVDDDNDGFEDMLITTAEAKAILKFLKKHLEPKLENV